uniref:Uncharacterized protein n=1 Tax=Glossina pallidipes TaxID=7398 RepID=A0A1A9ZEZ6_GLOPL
MVASVPCAVHHPQQHQQQQMALMAAMQAHMAATGAGPLPPHPTHMHHHHGPPPGPHGPPPLPPPNQHGHQPLENGHVASGISPSGSTASNISSGSSGNGINAGNVLTAPGPPPPGPVYIQYHGEFYPAEYYLAPHPHEGICPQHPHHPQPMCAIPTDFVFGSMIANSNDNSNNNRL